MPPPYLGLESFNDRCGGIAELRAAIVRARNRALFEAAQTSKRNEEMQALLAAEAEQRERRQAAASLYRELILARLERERTARTIAGDSRGTYILCPGVREPERRAA